MGQEVTSVADFLRVCGIRHATQELASARTSMGFTALHFCVVGLSLFDLKWSASIVAHWAQDAINAQRHNERKLAEWSKLAQQLILHGGDVHHPRIGQSCFMLIASEDRVDCFRDKSFKALLDRILHWLRLLLNAGVDLVKYGSREADLLLRSLGTDYKDADVGREFLLSGLVYGSEVEDWSLQITPFGEIPFHQKERAPGAWIDDDWVPSRIAWPPAFEDGFLSGRWNPWDCGLQYGSWVINQEPYLESKNVQVLFGMPFNVRSQNELGPLPPVEAEVSGT